MFAVGEESGNRNELPIAFVQCSAAGTAGGAAPKLRGDEKIDVQWADVSRMVGTRNRIACQKKWEYLQVCMTHDA